MKIIEKEFNIQTGEETIVEREISGEELSKLEADKALAEAEVLAKAEAESAKAALLEKLGITEEEAKLLLS